MDTQGVTTETKTKKKKDIWSIIFELGCGCALLVLLLLIATSGIPGFLRAREQAQFTTCKNNLGIISTACEKYAGNNNSSYPKNLEMLVGKYLKELPKCPRNSKMNYYYEKNDKGCIIYCSGKNHTRIIGDSDGPAYSSYNGLKDLLTDAQKVK